MSNYPIQRLVVYPAYPGTTWITWDLHPNMQDPLPYTFQLQRCRTANPDDESWENIGASQTNVVLLTDEWLSDTNSVRSGYLLDCFYRVVLTTPRGKYISEPEGCFGQLHRDEWKLANEILSKERLLFKKTAVPGVLLQAMRQGERCPHCQGTYDTGIANSNCEHCYGTGYLGGYHTPFQFQAWQVSPSQRNEIHYSDNVATINMSVDRYQARATGIPEVYNGDIWVDLSTAQRFRITASKVIAQIRRVPLVRIIDMTLIPASDVAYKIPIGDDNYSSMATLESAGCGPKIVNHNFPEKDDMRYITDKGRPIAGATITIESTETGEIVHRTTTNTNGRWRESYNAPLGTYKVTFEKEGKYGPDYRMLYITEDSLTPEERLVHEDKIEQQTIEYFKREDNPEMDFPPMFNV